MFEFIEPDEHRLYKDRILPFLDKLTETPRPYQTFEELDQATFLLANDETLKTKNDNPLKGQQEKIKMD